MSDSDFRWLVLRVSKRNNGTVSIDIVGLFSTEEKAIAACKDVNYLIGPLVQDVEIVDEVDNWLGSYYPLG